MPKFRVTLTETRELTFDEVEAENVEIAGELAKSMEASGIRSISKTIDMASRILAPSEIAYQLQAESIRRDYATLEGGKMPSGEKVSPEDARTIMDHLAKLHNALIDEHGLDGKLLGRVAATPTEKAKAAAVDLTADPQVIWEKCAAAFGWEYDPDYKGWIKRANKRPGAIHGEWDAYPRDQSAEDACNEEGIDTVEEAAQALSAEALS